MTPRIPATDAFPSLPPRCVPSRAPSKASDDEEEYNSAVLDQIETEPRTASRSPDSFFTTPSEPVALARDLVRIESITPNDNGCQELVKGRLERIGFDCETLQYGDVTNLWAVLRVGGGISISDDPTNGGKNSKKPIDLVFAGHTDVVPPGPAEKWTHPPFGGTIDGGVLYGRGTADMKGGVACFVAACERFVEKHPPETINNKAGDFSVGVLLTSDEEGPAERGTKEVLAELGRRGVSIGACLVGEPTSRAVLGDTIKVGRRGSLGGKLTVHGTQGHVAYPHLADNPLHLALGPLKALVDAEWDQGNDNFPPTSFQISNVNGGTGATNVIPGHKTVHFNFRYSPEVTHAELKERVEAILDGHGIRYDVDWSEPALPFETARESYLVDAVRDSVRAATGLEVELSTSGGTSDGRFVAASGCAHVVELGPVGASIHQVDERVSTADLDILADMYLDILERVRITGTVGAVEEKGAETYCQKNLQTEH